MEELSAENFARYGDAAMELVLKHGPHLLLAIVVLLVGLRLIRWLTSTIDRALDSRAVEPTLGRFLASFAGVTLRILLLISVGSMIGIETTSFIAMLGAAGLAVGLALQGSLANFAGGVLILLFRPFKVGDFIEAQGVSGSVVSIQIFHTRIRTPDNKMIVVPNGALSNGIITNFSAESTRRVDFVFGIGYRDDLARAKSIIAELIAQDARALKQPPPQIVVSQLATSSVNITVRVWVDASDYWSVYFDLTERVKLAFDANGITIPFPQQDVHVYRAH